MDSFSADRLYGIVKSAFSTVKNETGKKPFYSSGDVLMSGLAIFSLKCPSLLAFDKSLSVFEPLLNNLHKLMGIEKIPSDTQMRERLDRIPNSELRKPFSSIHNELQKSGVYDRFLYKGKHIVAIDGTGFFSSRCVSCPNCMIKNSKTSGTLYEHQALGIVMVHPDHKHVLPFAPEFISNYDGKSKNDSERCAAKRLLASTRAEFPSLDLVVVEDGLSSNAPHIEALKENAMGFILGAKPGDHKFLYRNIEIARGTGELDCFVVNKDNQKYEIEILNDTQLNASTELRVNFLSVKVHDTKGLITVFSWATDQILDRNTWFDVMRMGRSRWKIENETFNTLKNQGYNFEHNYGHGKHYLCNNFGSLMFLQFLIDQVMEFTWSLFQEVRTILWARYAIWEILRSIFSLVHLNNWDELFHIATKRRSLFQGKAAKNTG